MGRADFSERIFYQQRMVSFQRSIMPVQYWMILILFFSLTGCEEESITRNGDFFPVSDHSKWEYFYEYFCDCPEDHPFYSYTADLYVSGDTTLSGKTYFKIRNEYDLIKLVRREGKKYFMWDNNAEEEFVFLDTELPVNATWIAYEDEFNKHEFTIVKAAKQMIVRNKTYHHVLAVLEKFSYDDGTNSSVVPVYHYYVEDVGEIATYHPATPYTYQSETKVSLVKFE